MHITKNFVYLLISVLGIYLMPLFRAFAPPIDNKQKVIIIGATSGIGEALAKELARRRYSIGLTGRRKDRLEIIQKEIIDASTYIRVIDVSKPEEAQRTLKELINQMGGLDIIIISAGTGNYDLDWRSQKEIVTTNVLGFVAITATAIEYFLKNNTGHLIGISSISALRGSAEAPVYSASKAFISNYLAGLRTRFKQLGSLIIVTTIEPGLVNTAMGQASDFWRATPEKAAIQIADAIERKQEHVYITKRWRVIAWLFKYCPDWIFYRLFQSQEHTYSGNLN